MNRNNSSDKPLLGWQREGFRPAGDPAAAGMRAGRADNAASELEAEHEDQARAGLLDEAADDDFRSKLSAMLTGRGAR